MSLLTSLVAHTTGGGQLPWVESIDRRILFANTVTTYPTANLAYFYRVRVGRPLTISTIAILNGATASGNVDVGIYTSSDGGTTLTRVASSGSTAASGTSAFQAVALTAAYTLQPGVDYWLAISVDNTTHTLLRVSISNATLHSADNVALMKTSTFPLPTSVASLSTATNAYVYLKAA